MTLTYRNILDLIPAFKDLSTVPMPAATALKVAMIITKIDAAYEQFNKMRAELYAQYEAKENMNEIFQTKLNELLINTVEINAEKISINELEKVFMTPKQAFALMQFIK